MTEKKKTYYAPAECATDKELREDAEFLAGFPVITELLNLQSGLLGVLNDKRQFVAINKYMIDSITGEEMGDLLGYRAGDAVNCIYSSVHEGGCGTSEMCSTCGAAIAIVGSLEGEKPVERNCSLVIEKKGKKDDLFLRVLSCPVNIRNKRFLLLFAQDISFQQKWAILEKVFLHDVSNILTGMMLALEMTSGHEAPPALQELLSDLRGMAAQMAGEIEIQRILTGAEGHSYVPRKSKADVAKLLKEILNLSANHPSGKGKLLKVPGAVPVAQIEVDGLLLKKVLHNMVINALEASDDGDEVRVEFDESEDGVMFSVWNKREIPVGIMGRVFQRNFTTKGGLGRGLGTYSMKLFGEEFLGGKVEFRSNEKEGTTFRFLLPK